jgi:hypothetical protein
MHGGHHAQDFAHDRAIMLAAGNIEAVDKLRQAATTLQGGMLFDWPGSL